MANLLPASWLPKVPMKRIHVHWTAGTNKANDTDKGAYHILFEGDGTPIKGKPSIAANSGGSKPGYAAHTLNANTDAIGVSLCGMAGAVENPFNAGKYPIVRAQWDAMVAGVAELAVAYGIPVTPKTILTHAEVEPNLGIKQRNKWDITRLAFNPGVVGAKAVGDMMRREVSLAVAKLKGETTIPAPDPEPIPAAGVAVTITPVQTSSTPKGEATGKLPEGTRLDVLGSSGDMVNVRTPGGYVVWVHRTGLKMVDGPQPLEPTIPDPRRAVFAELRAVIDRLEALL